MARDDRNGREPNNEPRSWADWKQEVFESIEELDRACANARQVIYKLRPLVRPKSERTEEHEEEPRRHPDPTPFRSRRRGRGDR